MEYRSGRDIIRMLRNGFSSIYKDDNSDEERYPFGYIEMFHFLFENKSERNEILMLGNAVGTLVKGLIHYCDRMNLQNINFDMVEIDKEYTRIGEEYFGLQKNDKRMNYFHEDARTFLNRDSVKKYDIIYFDIYSTDNNFIFPYHLITKEAITEIYQKLNDSGIFAMNIIGKRQKGHPLTNYINQIYTQINNIFPETKLYPTNLYDDDYGNYMIIGYKNPLASDSKNIKGLMKQIETTVETTNIVFTDNYAPIEKFLDITKAK